VFSEKYHLTGKIDVFHLTKKSLMERKSHISEVYQGYIYQLYAQYFCLTEMGYQVEKLKLYSMDDNKVYEIPLPDETTTKEFETFLATYQRFSPNSSDFVVYPEKCQNCIYHELCDSAIDEVP
jgi:CRISPR-associated protein Cas4